MPLAISGGSIQRSSIRPKFSHQMPFVVDGGQVFMPLNPYPFSPKFGWLSDRFGVSWQLNLVSG